MAPANLVFAWQVGWRRRDARQIGSAALEQKTCSATDGYGEARAARS